MAKWRVSGTVIGSKYLGEFEAETKEEAEELALNSPEAYVSFCHQCSEDCEDPQIESALAELIESEQKRGEG